MKATFAAGCFWHVEEIFRRTEGVLNTTVGYIGGNVENPTYEQVCTDNTGHAEAVQVEFDPSKVSYDDLLNIFWNNHNPTTLNRQGLDIGVQYRSAIFYHDSSQEQIAKNSKDNITKSEKFPAPIVTQIVPAPKFYKAEDYHQKYFLKNRLV